MSKMQEEAIHPLVLLKISLTNVTDFRAGQGKQYLLNEILALSILAMLCGAEDFTGMAVYCEEKEDFLRKYYKLKTGKTPSHDLFRWVFAHIDSNEFLGCFVEWTKVMSKLFPEEVIAIDGKAIRATRDSSSSVTSAIHLVSAWASENGMVLGQVRVDAKSNEKTAIPKLLKLLEIEGCIVTIDAMGTHPPIAQNILDKKADYLLALKKNNKTFFLEVESFFKNMKGTSLISDFAEEKSKGHGRVEHRKCYLITDLSYFPDAALWPKLSSLVCIESEVITSKKTTKECRYYVSSLKTNATAILNAVRKHWSIEINLHWRLDVTFNEDRSRSKFKNCPENLSIARKITLAILDADNRRLGGKNKKLRVALSEKYLTKLLKLFIDNL